MAKWRELEAQGVKRCCVVFKDGTRCKRRVLAGVYDSWCDKHGARMEAHRREHVELVKVMKGDAR